MDVDHPERDQDWDTAVRWESERERLDRNWSSLRGRDGGPVGGVSALAAFAGVTVTGV